MQGRHQEWGDADRRPAVLVESTQLARRSESRPALLELAELLADIGDEVRPVSEHLDVHLRTHRVEPALGPRRLTGSYGHLVPEHAGGGGWVVGAAVGGAVGAAVGGAAVGGGATG
jgi:hypothetical protein